MALELIKRYPEIATVEVNGFGSALSVLARKSTAFSSGRIAKSFRWRHLNPIAFMKAKRNQNLMEHQALELVKGLCKEIQELDDSKLIALLQHALHDAAKIGIPEIIEEIVQTFPPAIWFTDKDNFNVFQLAVLHRRGNVFDLIYQMTDYKYLITRFIDSDDNNMLHLVGRLPPSDRLSHVSGPALLVQREMQWYKLVSKIIPPAQRVAKNKQGKTPKMVFIEEHEQLMKDGAIWMKHTASSSAIFATLIATVAFAGVMHVPGGNDNKAGLPLLLHHKAFTLFTVVDAFSLILSLFSIIHFITIINSRYSEDDFHSILPGRLTSGIAFLMLSILFMLVAFSIAWIFLFNPAELKSQTIQVLRYEIILFLLLVMIVVLRLIIVMPISLFGMFWKKKHRILH